MENKFKVSLLAVSVLMGASLATSAAFAETATEIVNKLTADTNTELAGIKTAKQALDADTAYDAAAKEVHEKHTVAKNNKQAASNQLKDLTTEQMAVQNQAVLYLNQLYGNNAGANPTWEQVNKPSSYYITTAGGTLGDVDTAITGNANSKDSLFAKLLTSEQAVDTALSQATNGLIDKAKVVAKAGGKNATEITAIEGKVTYYQAVIKLAQKSNNLKIIADAAQQNLDQKKANLVKAIAENAGIDTGTKTALDTYLKTPDQANFDKLLTANTANATGLAASASGTKVVSSALSDYSGTDGTSGALGANKTAQTNYTTAKTKALSGVKGSDTGITKPADVTAAITGTGDTEAVDFTKLLSDYRNVIGNVTTGTPPAGSLIALAEANKAAANETQNTAFITQLATLNQAMGALQKAQQDYNTGLENAKRFQDRLTAINNSLIAGNLDFSAKSLALAAAPESAAFTTHDGLVTKLQTARDVYTSKILTAVNTDLSNTMNTAIAAYNDASGAAKDTARTTLIDNQLAVVQSKLELLSQLPKLAEGNFDGTADKFAALKTTYQKQKLAYEKAAKVYDDAVRDQAAKQANATAPSVSTDLNSTDPVKKAAAEKAIADLAAANFAVTQAGIALQKTAAYNTSAGVYTLPTLDETAHTGLLETKMENEKELKLAKSYDAVTRGIIDGASAKNVLIGFEDLVSVNSRLNDSDRGTAAYRGILNTTLNQTSHSLRAALPGMTAEARKAATDKYNAQLSLFLSDNGIGALGESVASLQTGIQAQRAASLNAGTFAAVSQADPTLYLGRADVTLNNDSIIPGYDHVIIESVPGAAGAAATLRIKNSFNNADLTALLGTTAANNPYRGTLQLKALQVNPNADKANTLTLDGKDAMGKSADLYFSVNGSALNITGNLLNDEIQYKDAAGTLTSLLGGTAAAPLKAQPDQIVLQNLNIHNDYQKSAQQAYIENNARAIEAAALQGITAATDAQKAAAKARADTYRSEATAALMSANPDLVGLNISASTVRQVLDNTVTVRNDIFTEEQTHSAPATANVMLSNVRLSVQNDSASGNATALSVSGDGVHLSVTGGEIAASAAATAKKYALDFGTTGKNNLADFSNSVISGDINDSRASGTPASPNEVRLTSGSVWTGNAHSTTTGTGNNYLKLVLDNSKWTGSSDASPDVVLRNNSLWTVKNLPSGSSSANTLFALAGSNLIDLVPLKSVTGTVSGRPVNQYESTGLRVEQNLTVAEGAVLNIKIGEYNGSSHRNTGEAGLAEYFRYGQLQADGRINNAGNISLILHSTGAQPLLFGNRLAAETDISAGHAHEFVLYKDFPPAGQPAVAYNPAISNSLVEAGVYQYQTVTDSSSKAGYKAVYFQSNGKLSNSAATVAGLAAAPASVAAIEGDALGKHITSLRHSEGSGVWISYYGGSNQNTLSAGPQYDLKTNGVMLGVDTAFADWMAGIAFTSGKASLSVLNSSGNVNNYGAQFWLSRHYSNGVFVDGVAQFGHYANKAKVSMLDGTPARGEYATNGYGLSAKVGYAYQQASGFYAEPYVQATARAFSGAAYNLDNGMVVNSTDYKSFVGEIGTDLGYTVPMASGYFKPYLHLAVLNEFANGNSVRANNIDLQNSINGAAFRIGVGGELLIMKNFGGYLSYDYTKGSNTERPWQVNLGVNYTW